MDIDAKIKRSEARAERIRKRGSLGVELPENDCRRKISCRLMNLGNSCYQNCVLQMLFNLPDVRQRLFDFACQHQNCEEEYCFPRDLADFAGRVPEAAAKGQALSATWVLKYQQAGEALIGSLYRQSDPACFLHAAAEWSHDRVSPEHQLTLFQDLFEGEAYEHEWSHTKDFPSCKAAAKDLRAQPFLMLNIPVPANPATLETCLAESVFEDKVVGGRECDDANCPYGRDEEPQQQEEGSKPKPPRHAKHQQLRLAKLPKYLYFRLLRFDNSLRKIRTPVMFSEHLDLSRLHDRCDTATISPQAKPAASSEAGDKKRRSPNSSNAHQEQTPPSRIMDYDLMAVVVHQGRTRQRGHFYVMMKVLEDEDGCQRQGQGDQDGSSAEEGKQSEEGQQQQQQGGRWWLFDDAKRHIEVDITRVLHSTDEVYMLLYRRRGEYDGNDARAASAQATPVVSPSSKNQKDSADSGSSNDGRVSAATAAATAGGGGLTVQIATAKNGDEEENTISKTPRAKRKCQEEEGGDGRAGPLRKKVAAAAGAAVSPRLRSSPRAAAVVSPSTRARQT